MTLQVKISVRAAAEIRRANDWWNANRSSAPGAIGKDFGEAVALLAEQPGIGARYQGTRTPHFRRLYLGRVGYFVYYRVASESLHVLAF